MSGLYLERGTYREYSHDRFHPLEQFNEFPWPIINDQDAGFGRGGTHYAGVKAYDLQDDTRFWSVTRECPEADSGIMTDVWLVPRQLVELLEQYKQWGREDARQEIREALGL